MAQILVPLDGSLLAERALPLAATLARRTGDELRLIEAINLPMGEDLMGPWTDLEIGARDYLNGQAERLAQAYGVGATTVAHFGTPAPLILREAQMSGVSFVVMTTHGREGLRRAVLGSVAEHVLREALVPVFLLPAAAPERDVAAIKHIAVALDGSSLAEAVLEPVSGLARRLEAAVTLVRVFEQPTGPVFDERGSMVRTIDQEFERIEFLAQQYLEPLASRLRAFGVEANYSTAVGHKPAEAILRLAAAAQADLIAMATHSRSGLDRLRYGSVTEEVLRHSHLPLLAFGRASLEQLHEPERQVPEGAQPEQQQAVVSVG